ncbi:MAG: hypothetical protein SFU86_22820 [Pirellulaceae bacterium]|nr:hypothetical protein [Pirellulaceae bacterium]
MQPVWRPVLLSLALATCLPGFAAAQSSFSFSIGSYGGCRPHHHHHCWGPSYGWYAPPPVFSYYYAPPPRVTYVQPLVVQPAVIQPAVIQPQQTRTEPTPASPIRTAAARTEGKAETLQIWNNAGRQLPVAFLADAQVVELRDGQSHTFYGGGPRVIEFDRGGAFGSARYELTGGEHEFVATSRGWDLVAKTNRPAPIALQPQVPKNSLPSDTAAR